MLTWPKFTVSRIGSNAAANAAATARVNQRLHPRRRATGPSSQYSTQALAAALSTRLIAIATGHGTTAIGSMVRAANGGYVNPYVLWYRM